LKTDFNFFKSPSKKLSPAISSRQRRKADSSPEVEVTKVLSKEDKIDHVTLSSSADEDEQANQVNNNDFNSVTDNENQSSIPIDPVSEVTAALPQQLEVTSYSSEQGK